MSTVEKLEASEAQSKHKGRLSNFTFILLAVLGLLGVLVVTFLATRGGALTDSRGASLELTNRVEKIFSQRLSIPKEDIIVDLGSEEPLLQLENHTAREVRVTVAPSGEEAAALLADLTGVQKEWVTVSGGSPRLGGAFDVPLLGKITAGVSQSLAVAAGELTTAPDGFYLSGIKVPADQNTALPLVGEWVKQFTTAQNHCIVDHVPNGFELREITVSGSTVTMNFTAEDVSLSLSELQKTASCGQ